MSRKSTGKPGTSLLASRARVLGGSGARSIAVVACLAIALLALFASAALAAETHPYTGVSFGPDGVGGSQNFQGVRSITVDPANGDVYVYDAGTGSIYKFDSAGAPENFSSTGTNVITGVGGNAGGAEFEIALAPAGAPGGTAGDIYVATNAQSVKVYAASGAELGEVEQGGETCGVATDPSGNLYAGVYNKTVNKYTPDANPPTTANKEVGTIDFAICNVAADGLGNVYAANYSGQGLFKIEGILDPDKVLVDPSASTMAIAPGTNNVYADRTNEVAIYDPAGTQIGSFGNEEISQSRGIGVNSGETKIYVATPEQVKVFGASATVPDATTEATTGIFKVSATLHGTIGAAGGPEATCSFEYATQQQFSEHGFQGASEKPCSPAGPFTGSGTTPVTATATGLVAETAYVVRLVGANENGHGNGPALHFATPGVVNVATTASTAVTDHAATLNGTVNPEGTELEECFFEYGEGVALANTAPCVETPAQIGTGNAFVPVHADLTGLTSATEYSFRLVGKSALGSSQANVETLKTHGPKIEAQFAAFVGSTTATLKATINPNNAPTTYRFEYTDDASFQARGYAGATRIPVPDLAVGAGSISKTVTAEISGLQASMVYHFRVAATSPDGTAEGPDKTFTTYSAGGPFPPCGNEALRYAFGALLPDCRAYEQATPINKNGTNPLATLFTSQAGSNGGAITFWAPAGVPGGKGAGTLTTYAALRGTDGWSTVGLLPPAWVGQFTDVLGSTPDLAYTISTATELNVSGEGLFLQNNADGSVTTMVPYQVQGETVFGYVGASSDASKVFFEAEVHEGAHPLTPEAATGKDNLYVWDRSTGDVSLVGVLPSSACGSSPCAPAGGSFAGGYNTWENNLTSGGALAGEGGLGSNGEFFTQAQHDVSEDGSKAYFSAGETGEVFLRKNVTSPAATTVKISASQKTNGSGPGGTDPNGPRPAAFAMATPDGSKAFLLSPEELTNDATTGEATVGRANLDGTAPQPGFAPAGSVAGVAVDGGHVYWAEPGLDAIGRANLDGTGATKSFVTGADNPRGVAVDGGHVYWTNAKAGADGEGTIGRANLDGTGVEESFITGASNPQGLAVNGEHVYWANQGSATQAIGRAKLDGSEVEQAFVPVGEIENPASIAVDSNYIYYSRLGTPWLGRVGLAGTGNEPFYIYSGVESGPKGIAVDSGHIYWSNPRESTIGRAKLDLSGQEESFITGATDPQGIALDGAHVYWGNESADSGNDLYRYEAESGNLTDLVPDPTDLKGADVQGVIGTSDDGSRVYFAANGDLDGSGPAAAGNCHVTPGAQWTGECSLYLWHEGQITFVAKLDVSGGVTANENSDAANWAIRATQSSGNASTLNSGRVSANGNVVVFRSQRKLTSYDNEGVPEYYRYAASNGSLDCVTCNPSNIAPVVGGPELQVKTSVLSPAAAAPILTHNLSDSGDQLFFETADALLPSDTNGLADVYEWEADGAGSCQTSSEDGGCLYLISTGTSTEPSHIADASASGDEVFFLTEQKLVGQDEDNLIDVYDARVEGGLAGQNPQRAPACSGEACKGPSTQPPATKGAASAVFQGPGNAAGQVACVAAPTIKRLTKSAKSLRGQARKLKGKAKKASTTKQNRKLKAKAHGLSKSAQADEKRAKKLTKGCSGVGGKGAR
jgi:virginiamycin B lyase